MDSTIAILALIVSVGAVIVGPLVSARVARNEMLGQMRQEWINSLREVIAKLMSETTMLCAIKAEGVSSSHSDFNYIRDLALLSDKISLLLNHNEDEHISLMLAMEKMNIASLSGDADQFHKYESQVLDLSVAILKTEWEVVKGTKSRRFCLVYWAPTNKNPNA